MVRLSKVGAARALSFETGWEVMARALLQSTGDAKEVAGVDQAIPKADYFYGRLVEVSLSNPVTGKVLADTDCKAISGGITNCTTIIQADNGMYSVPTINMTCQNSRV